MAEHEMWGVQLRKGVVQILVLQLLASEPLHGYAVVKRLEALGDFVAGEGTVYPVLRRLEAAGYLDSRWEGQAQAKPRKYYAINDEGRAFLRTAVAEWKRIDSAIRGLEEGST